MLFTTAKFLGFFVVAFSVYWLIGRHRGRLLWLTAASAVFYMAWKWQFILLLLASTSVGYPVRHPLDCALYILFCPHLVAGPLVRANDFLPQVYRPKRFDWPRVQAGAHRFLIGLFKKIVIADQVALAVDPVFAAPGTFSSTAL